MVQKSVITLIDEEIARLQQVRAVLSGVRASKRGRPPLVREQATDSAKPTRKRNLTPEGRARIAAAVKRRWAAQKKAMKQA